MEVNYFQILLIDVTFYFQLVSKLTGIVLIKKCKENNIIGTGDLRVRHNDVWVDSIRLIVT